ncbi:MAG: hypothetical protein A3B44_02010 [Candidatus Levybacteria bacterium RIFCSPLOWO2_01_FULL_38_21]|nr:MAG: hypothetical protein A3B44_02010 [Candidatus Levybacteria bacterium RIFCSPLOWO2_01_FULL_38_21]
MKNKFLFILSFIILLAFLLSTRVFAENFSKSSAVLADAQTVTLLDNRVKILREFLESYNSPITPFAKEFVETADIYNLDWRLLVAISGVESTFGHQIPAGSFNGWGWGVYGNNVTYFSSWTEGIKIISKGIRENYMDKWGATDIYQVGRMYAASPTWAVRVEFFMGGISNFSILNPKDSLSISL